MFTWGQMMTDELPRWCREWTDGMQSTKHGRTRSRLISLHLGETIVDSLFFSQGELQPVLVVFGRVIATGLMVEVERMHHRT